MILAAALSSASQSCSAAPVVLACMFLLSILAPLLAGLVWGRRPGMMVPAVVGVYRIAKDGRAFIQVGRVCHFGRRGETEQDLRSRIGVL